MIIAIDTETGGTNPSKSALLSISACHLADRSKNFTVFIQPAEGLEIDAEAAAVNGYSPELWKERGAVPLLDALRRFKAWLPYSGNDPLAHNAGFRQGVSRGSRAPGQFQALPQIPVALFHGRAVLGQ
jgi:DNA polymerase III epsilon subunit-like protein